MVMKRFSILLALAVSLAFFVASCSSGGGGDNTNENAQLTGTVQIQGASNQNQ